MSSSSHNYDVSKFLNVCFYATEAFLSAIYFVLAKSFDFWIADKHCIDEKLHLPQRTIILHIKIQVLQKLIMSARAWLMK